METNDYYLYEYVNIWRIQQVRKNELNTNLYTQMSLNYDENKVVPIPRSVRVILLMRFNTNFLTLTVCIGVTNLLSKKQGNVPVDESVPVGTMPLMNLEP